MSKNLKDLNFILTFGKYKDKSVEDILGIDPSYLVWAHNNIEWFKLEEGILDEAIDSAYKEKMNYYIENFDFGIDPYDWCD